MTDESSQPKVKSFVHRIPNPVGRPYKIKSSQELWDKFVAYCDDVENDPWQQKTGSNSIAGGSGKSTNSMRQEVRVFSKSLYPCRILCFLWHRSEMGGFQER